MSARPRPEEFDGERINGVWMPDVIANHSMEWWDEVARQYELVYMRMLEEGVSDSRLARYSGPPTSVGASKSGSKGMDLLVRAMALAVLWIRGPSTFEEITTCVRHAAYSKTPLNSVTPRCSEMYSLGLIRCSGWKGLSNVGHPVEVWCHRDKLMEETILALHSNALEAVADRRLNYEESRWRSRLLIAANKALNYLSNDDLVEMIQTSMAELDEEKWNTDFDPDESSKGRWLTIELKREFANRGYAWTGPS